MYTKSIPVFPKGDPRYGAILHIRFPEWEKEGDCALEAKPTLLMTPGGGYVIAHLSKGAFTIAPPFEAMGYRVAALDYRCQRGEWLKHPENGFPGPVADAMRAMRILRANAKEWGIQPDAIISNGSSAGGHLAMTTCCTRITDAVGAAADCGDEIDKQPCRPNGAIIGYPVITGCEGCHEGSVEAFLCEAHPTPEQRELFSIEKNVDKDTPPVFVWTCEGDTAVPPTENALALRYAMKAAGRPCTCVMFDGGKHGVGLALDKADISLWPRMAHAAMRRYGVVK